MNNQPFSFENFHLDPQDFQNFLLINPPLTEYSNRYMAQRGVDQFLDDNMLMENNNVMMQPSHQQHLQPQQQQQLPPTTQQQAQQAQQPMSLQSSASISASTHHNQYPNNNNNNQPYYSIPLNHYTDSNDLILPSRRLSISNGQIGQISMMVHQNYENDNDFDNSTVSSNDLQFKERKGLGPGSAPASGSVDFISNQTQNNGTTKIKTAQPDVTLATVKEPITTTATATTTTTTTKAQLQTEVPINGQLPTAPSSAISTKPGQVSSGAFETDQNGVPTRKLVYNNEVIFNPNEPIPGTNAWKRNKILERNRIAASKCRAKKKNMQKQLQDRVDTLNFENNKLKEMLYDIRTRLIKYGAESNVNFLTLLPQDPEPDDEEIDENDDQNNNNDDNNNNNNGGDELKNQIDQDRKNNDRVEKLLERRRVFEKKKIVNKRVDAFIKSGVL
ncbi:Cst6 protein [Pichia kluyveri]|uniref:Cst6 protein n=1 Tax=Pichia kluyveri TaxID=36015 RepID=A0AAV5R6R6_PICKL|nr:Cst6 protein [Pichia kluyveri]